MKASTFILLFISLCMFSCDMYPQDDFEEVYVVESFLVAERQLPFINLSTTVPVEQEFDYSGNTYGVNGAEVKVHLLERGKGSNIEKTFAYEWENHGKYITADTHKVLPSRTYELQVKIPNSNDAITAHTTVPDTFKIIEGVQDSIVYESEEQLEITVSESSYPGRQNIFILNAESVNPQESKMIPHFYDLYVEGGKDRYQFQKLAKFNTGIINEGNFSDNENGTYTIKYPWGGLAFYEENQIIINTIDDNIYDFERSSESQMGGSSLAPGEIQNVIYNVDGGIGVFGSMASDTALTYLKRP